MRESLGKIIDLYFRPSSTTTPVNGTLQFTFPITLFNLQRLHPPDLSKTSNQPFTTIRFCVEKVYQL